MNKLAAKKLLKFIMIESYSEMLRHQKLIDEWNDPKDIAQRAAVLIKNIHMFYGCLAFKVYQNMQEKEK